MDVRCKYFALAVSLFLGVGMFSATPAHAQASRTWVSGVGDDVNPCSRTAPCKTFAGAISKTAAGGEINCLDPGGFGAVTITKSITINCLYTEGGVLAGGNGIVVNAGATDVVYLRGLDIFGVNPPIHGVRFIAGGALHIEDCVIRRFNAVNSFGVSFQPSGASSLFISNTTIAENGNGSTGGGILLQPTGAAGVGKVTLNNVRLYNNAFIGLRVDTAGNTAQAINFVDIEDSAFVGNAVGIFVSALPGPPRVTMLLNDSRVTNNRNTGISVSGANSTIRVGNSTIHGNVNGLLLSNGGVLNTYGNNRLNGNGVDGAFTQPPIPLQ